MQEGTRVSGWQQGGGQGWPGEPAASPCVPACPLMRARVSHVRGKVGQRASVECICVCARASMDTRQATGKRVKHLGTHWGHTGDAQV